MNVVDKNIWHLKEIQIESEFGIFGLLSSGVDYFCYAFVESNRYQ